MRLILISFICLLSLQATEKPNVIFFAVDDMNDWIGPMGSKMAKTPNMDRLAKMGVTFTNAHTSGVYCAPSRTAIFTGRNATTSGCYTDQIYFHNHPDYIPLHMAFNKGGYNTYGVGKLFHHPTGHIDPRGWTEFHLRTEDQRKNGWPVETWAYEAPMPAQVPASKFNQVDKKWKGRPFMEVGAIPNDKEEEIVDTLRTKWACEVISKKHDKPFFMALGLYAPHFPNYAPQRFFDMYPIESIKHGPWKGGDLDDIPQPERKKKLARKKGIHDKLIELGIVESTIQGYLASISYADSNLGRVLDALENSPNKDNTIIVFWSDHGYAQGEKGNWGKHTMWQRTTNVPFMWAGPGIAKGKTTSYTSVLIDMYPTLTDLCGITPDKGLDGKSLKSILAKPANSPERTVFVPYTEPKSYTVINEKWRYIKYKEGGEELYDLRKDFHEWNNLADKPEYKAIKEEMITHGPKKFAPIGTSKKKLKLVLKGDSYEWIKK